MFLVLVATYTDIHFCESSTSSIEELLLQIDPRDVSTGLVSNVCGKP